MSVNKIKEEIHLPRIFGILLIILLSQIMYTPVKADIVLENEEYGFKVSFDYYAHLCVYNKITPKYGVVGTVLDGTNCDELLKPPSFYIWADFNSSFSPDALTYLGDYQDTRCEGETPYWAEGEWETIIDGSKTAMCRVNRSDGNVTIILAAGSHEEWEDRGFGKGMGPERIYLVYLESSDKRLENDLVAFNTFLRSIRLLKI